MSQVDYLSALNTKGSGLNITQIVDALVDAEKTPQTSLKYNNFGHILRHTQNVI